MPAGDSNPTGFPRTDFRTVYGGNRWNHKEINRRDPVRVIVKEGLPGLRRSISSRHHVLRDCRLGDLEAELEKLTVDVWGTPERVLETHSSNKVAHLFVDPRSATEGTGLPSPERTEAPAMPTHDRLRPYDRYGVKDPRKATIEPNEQSAISPGQIQSTWCTLLQDVELMPQHQDFGFKPPSRFEEVAQHADEKEGSCDHSAIMF